MLTLLALTVAVLPPGAVASFGSPRLTAGGAGFALSPDGAHLGGVRDQQAVVIPVAGGPPAATPVPGGSTAEAVWPAGGDLCWVEWLPAGFGCFARRPDGSVVAAAMPHGRSDRPLLHAHPSPDGKTVLAVWQTPGGRREADLWPFQAGKGSDQLARLRPVALDLAATPDVRPGRFSGDSAHYLFPARDAVQCVALATGKPAWVLNRPGANFRAVASADGQTVAVVQDADLRRTEAAVWHGPTGKPVARLDTPAGTGPVVVAVTPDGKRVVALVPDGDRRLGGVIADPTGLTVGKLEPQAVHLGIVAVTVSGDGRRLAAFGHHSVGVWNLDTGADAQPGTGHRGSVTGLLLTPDNKWVISTGDDRTVRCWAADTGAEKWATSVPAAVRLAGLTPDAAGVLLADARSQAAARSFGPRVLRVADGKSQPLPERLADPAIELVAFSPDGTTVVGQTADEFRLLAWPSGRRLRVIPFDAPPGRWQRFEMTQVQFAAAGAELVGVARYDRLPGVSPEVGFPVRVERYAVADGKLLSAKLVRDNAPRLATAFGRLVYLIGHANPTAFDAADGAALGRLSGAGQVTAVAAPADNRRLVVAGPAGVRVIDPADGSDRGVWPPVERPVTALAFSPDGRRLVTGDAAGVCVVWDADRHLP